MSSSTEPTVSSTDLVYGKIKSKQDGAEKGSVVVADNVKIPKNYSLVKKDAKKSKNHVSIFFRLQLVGTKSWN